MPGVLHGGRKSVRLALAGTVALISLGAPMAALAVTPPASTGTIAVGSDPSGVLFSPDSTTAYVANFAASTVSVIDTATQQVTQTIALAANSFPQEMALSKDGTSLYVDGTANSSVSVIDTATDAVTHTIPVGVDPEGIAVSPDGSTVYVVNSIIFGSFDGSVSIIDAATDTVTNTIGVGPSPYGVAVSPDGASVYVVNSNSTANAAGSVSVIDAGTGAITSTIPVGIDATQVAITPDGATAYVVNGADSSVSVITTATRTVTATLSVGPTPHGIAISPDGSTAYITNSTVGTMSIIDVASETVLPGSVNVGSTPVGVAISPDSKTAYITNNGTSTVTVLDTGLGVPVVSTDPTDQQTLIGSAATFTVAATGLPTPTVRWQLSTDSGAHFADIAGATALTYTTPVAAATDDGNQYRAVFTNSFGNATSAAATLTVVAAPTVTLDPADQQVSTGATATFTATASGMPAPTVQWQLSTNGGATFADIPGAIGANYTTATTAAADDGNEYRAVFTNTAGNATSTAATLTVVGAPTTPPASTMPPASTTPPAPTTSTAPIPSTAPTTPAAGTGALAMTGANVAGETGVAIALLLGGAGAMWLGRKRSRAH